MSCGLLLPILVLGAGVSAGGSTEGRLLVAVHEPLSIWNRLGILLTLDTIAAIAIVATLRRLWRLHHPRRWQDLPAAPALAVVVGFFVEDDARVLVV
jgi:hypothetical protein